MGDFFQTGAISILRRLGHTDLEYLELELKRYQRHNPRKILESKGQGFVLCYL